MVALGDMVGQLDQGLACPIDGLSLIRLPFDLRPGESIDVPVAVRLPPHAGDYRLEIVVRQGLQGAFDLSGPAAAPTPVVVR